MLWPKLGSKICITWVGWDPITQMAAPKYNHKLSHRANIEVIVNQTVIES